VLNAVVNENHKLFGKMFIIVLLEIHYAIRMNEYYLIIIIRLPWEKLVKRDQSKQMVIGLKN
jgi:hypothetical protein